MKAMCIDENRNFIWRDVPDPVCHGEFDVKLRVKACALNRADLMQRQGIYAPPEGWPLWPGLECAGEVVEAPAGGRFTPGDMVCALLGGGGYAEEVVVPEGMCMPLPKCFATMNMLGRRISLASMAGPETTIDVNLLWRKNLRLIGSTLRRRSPAEKTQILAGLVRSLPRSSTRSCRLPRPRKRTQSSSVARTAARSC